MGAKKILVVEDNEDNRDIITLRLRKMGSFEILIATNGKEAVEMAAQARPDLILMDLKMPVMDGLEATRLLRESDWGRSLPVIAITALAVEGDREKALNAGCTDYIPKPITDYSIIERKVRELLG
jgi:two-component system, cell cycle response regulator DivK